MWYEAALQQIGFEKTLDLDISITAHTEKADETYRKLRDALSEFGKERE